MRKLKLQVLQGGAGEVLSRAQLKNVIGGDGGSGSDGGSGACCTAYCYDEDSALLGTISLGDTCGGEWDCRDFYDNAFKEGCGCS